MRSRNRTSVNRIDQDLPHQARGDGEELRAIGPLHVLAAAEPEEGFVYQRGGLEEVSGA
jgi:hypothetical protein